MRSPEFELKLAERVGEGQQEKPSGLCRKGCVESGSSTEGGPSNSVQESSARTDEICKFSSLSMQGPALVRVDTKRSVNQLFITLEKLELLVTARK